MNFEIKIPNPFSFVPTLKTHGWFQLPPFYWDDASQQLLWVVRFNDGVYPVRVREAQQNANHTIVECEVHDASMQKLVERKFRHIFNLDLDLSEYYELCRNDGLLSKVPERGIGRLMRAESLYEDIFKSICGTNVLWKQAVKMIHAIAQLGDTVPGTEFRAFPTVQQVLDAGEGFLRDIGRVGYRSSYLVDLARRFANGEPQAERIEKGEMAPHDMKKYFLSFKGIGKTTAHYLLALYGYYEEMAVDSLVIKYMKNKHFAGIAPTEQQVVTFYGKYGRWKYLVYWMEFIVNEGWNPDA